MARRDESALLGFLLLAGGVALAAGGISRDIPAPPPIIPPNGSKMLYQASAKRVVVPVSNAPVMIMEYNDNRQWVLIQNSGAVNVFIGLDEAEYSPNGFKLLSAGNGSLLLDLNTPFKGRLWATNADGGTAGAIYAIEVSKIE